MPSEVMDHRRLSFFSEELNFPTEKQVGFWKLETAQDTRGKEEMQLMLGRHPVSSSPLNRLRPIGTSAPEKLEFQTSFLSKDQKSKFGSEQQFLGNGKANNMLINSWRPSDQDYALPSELNSQFASLFSEGKKVDSNGLRYENDIFSSSMSEIFDKKMKISTNAVSLGKGDHYFGDDLPIQSMEEIEAQTIGNLLPDDDDLLFDVIGDIGYMAQTNSGDDIDDDIFCSLGGMELESDDHIAKNAELNNGMLGSLTGEHPFGEHPSRTLFVRNINSDVEDSELKLLFEQFGDIRALYTTCKHRGFVMISYYDIRAARNALRDLQNMPLRRRKLDIHFSIPKDNPSDKDINQGTLVVFNLDPSVSNDDIVQIFGIYGEIKEIRETPHKQHHKFIEFYDIRAAEAALRALNKSDIAGKKIKLEPSRPGGARRCSFIQQLSPELDLESPPTDSPLGSYGSLPLNAIRAPGIPYMETTNHGISSILPQNISSPIRAPLGNLGQGESGYSLGRVNFGFQGMPVMQHHSLPEHHDVMPNGIPYNASSIPAMAVNIINSRPGEGFDSRFAQRVGPGNVVNQSFEHADNGGNGSCPVHGNQFMWNNGNAYPHRPSGPMMWSGSPSFANNIHPQQMHGFPRTPSHMMNPVVPLNPHHVGSAPSIWERRQPYVENFLDAPNFHPGSLGTMMHPLHNMFPHSGGNCIDPSQQRFFHGRNHLIAAFDGPNDRARSRRNDSNGNQGDNKRYELDVERIARGDDLRTTLMIKNIPNKYTSKMLLAAIDEQHKGTYDFIYLPIDFKNKCNVGYAFINLIDPQQIIPFFKAFNGKKWEKFNSEKVASLAYARIQGKAALIAHFQNSSLMNEDKRCRPILFHSDGPNAGDQEPFPMGLNIRSRPGRSRTCANEENQASPSTSPNGTEE